MPAPLLLLADLLGVGDEFEAVGAFGVVGSGLALVGSGGSDLFKTSVESLLC